MTGARYRLATVMASLMIIIAGCMCTGPDDDTPSPDGMKQVSKQESLEIMEAFIRNSPTFAFDGISESLSLKETLTARCPSCWVFIFEFQCRNAGYGNRSGQEIATVITPHTATIAIQQGEITSAELDGAWDMLNQKSFE